MEQKEEPCVDETQEETFDKIINPDNINDIKLKIPKNEFIEENIDNTNEGFASEGNISSGRENNKIKEKYGYTFNINGFEANSIAYFNEILLGNKKTDKSNCFNIKFDFKKGDIFKINKSTSDYLNMIVNSEFDLEGDIDGVITDVKAETITKAKKDNPFNLFTSDKFLKPGKTYDIFCESTFGLIDKLMNKNSKGNKKITQLKKLIFIIELIKNINNNINDHSEQPKKDLKIAINKLFHHKELNDIIICIIVDGNYKTLIQQIKNSCLFAKEWKVWKNPEENGITQKLYDYFELLRNTKIPFLIVYCPRFYERTSNYYNPLSKTYIEDNDVGLGTKIFNLESENANLKQKIQEQDNKIKEQDNKIKEQDNKIKEQDNKVKEQDNKIKEQGDKIKELEERINNFGQKGLLRKKRTRLGLRKKKTKEKKTSKKDN